MVADCVSEALTEEALELEPVVFTDLWGDRSSRDAGRLRAYDKVTETIHAVGYDGSAARYFRSLESDRVPSDSPRSRGIPMSRNDTNQPEQTSPETNEKVLDLF